MHPEGLDRALGATFGALKSVVTPLCASPLLAAAFATEPPRGAESATPNWARAGGAHAHAAPIFGDRSAAARR